MTNFVTIAALGDGASTASQNRIVARAPALCLKLRTSTGQNGEGHGRRMLTGV